MSRSTFRLSPQEVRAAFGIFCLQLVAKWESLSSFRYGIDDYLLAQDTGGAIARQVLLSQGRPGQWLWHQLLSFFGLSPMLSIPALGLFSIICLSVASVYVLRTWIEAAGEGPEAWYSQRFFTCVLAGFLVHGHPFYSDALLYRHSAATQGITALLSAAGVRACFVGGRRFVIGVGLITLALVTGPISVNGALMVLAGIGVFGSLRGLATWRRTLGGMGAATALYLLICAVIFRGFGVAPEGRWGFLSFAEIQTRATDVARLGAHVLGGEEPVAAARWLLLAMLVSVVAAIVTRRLRASVALWLWIAVSLVAWMATSVVGRQWSINPRTLCAVSAVYALFALLAAFSGHERVWAKIVFVVAALMSLGFVGESNRLFADQMRINAAERTVAVRVLAALDRTPGSEGVHRIVMDGTPSTDHVAAGDPHFETNRPIWGFYLHPREFVLSELSFTKFERPLPEDWRSAAEVCAATRRWPDPASVKVVGPLAIICF